MRIWFEWILLQIGIKLLSRSFKHIDIYSPKDDVEAITFSVSEKYIEQIEKIK